MLECFKRRSGLWLGNPIPWPDLLQLSNQYLTCKLMIIATIQGGLSPSGYTFLLTSINSGPFPDPRPSQFILVYTKLCMVSFWFLLLIVPHHGCNSGHLSSKIRKVFLIKSRKNLSYHDPSYLLCLKITFSFFSIEECFLLGKIFLLISKMLSCFTELSGNKLKIPFLRNMFIWYQI